MSVAIGIDIGTSYFSVAYWKLAVVQVCNNEFESIRTPSFLVYNLQTPQAIGLIAKENAHLNWPNAIYDIKKILGRKYNDPVTQKLKQNCTFIIECDGNNEPVVKVTYKENTVSLRPVYVQGSLISNAKKLLEHHLGETVDGAVVAVPAHFDENQRRATVDACTVAGLKVFKLINEPTAAIEALTFEHFLTVNSKTKYYLVFDMGSSLKITVVYLERQCIYKICATLCEELSGDDFDDKIVDYMIRDIRARYQAQFTPGMYFRRYMKVKAENAKITLSSTDETVLEVLSYVGVLTRKNFERLCIDLLAKIRFCLYEVLRKARITPKNIHKLVVVGGASKMPMVQKILSRFFKRRVYVHESCDGMVAFGAAVQAAMLSREISPQLHDLLPMDVVPNSLGISHHKVMMVIVGKGMRLPCVQRISVATLSESTEILEGENYFVLKNRVLGTMTYPVPRHPIHHSVIDIKFEVDVYCILRVTLLNRYSGQRNYKKYYTNAPHLDSDYKFVQATGHEQQEEQELPVQKVGTIEEELKRAQLWIWCVRMDLVRIPMKKLLELRVMLPRIMDKLNKDFVGIRRSRSSLTFSSATKSIATRRQSI